MNLITTKLAATMLGLTPDAVRWHERQGHILALRVDRGDGDFQRLFVKEDIERFQRQRAAKTSSGASHPRAPERGMAQ